MKNCAAVFPTDLRRMRRLKERRGSITPWMAFCSKATASHVTSTTRAFYWRLPGSVVRKLSPRFRKRCSSPSPAVSKNCNTLTWPVYPDRPSSEACALIFSVAADPVAPAGGARAVFLALEIPIYKVAADWVPWRHVRHSGESRNPGSLDTAGSVQRRGWIPASAGMTKKRIHKRKSVCSFCFIFACGFRRAGLYVVN